MAFRDCILSARDQGELTPGEADDLLRRFEAHVEARRRAGSADPEAEARNAMASQFDNKAAQIKMQHEMQQGNWADIDEKLQTFRNRHDKADVYEASMRLFENFGSTGFDSVVGAARGLISIVHGKAEELLRAFERNYYTGMRHQKPLAYDIVREIHGEVTNRPEAKAFAGTVAEINEMLRVMYNSKGGNIAKLEGGYIPHRWNPVAFHNAGFEKFAQDFRARLAPEKMYDPLTGELGMTPARVDESLRPVYDTVLTEGWAGREPTAAPVGKGSLANQRQEHRFLIFKSADDWKWVDDHYGQGDPYETILRHWRGMTSDIAAMQVLGPNPPATVERLKQTVLSEHGKLLTGEDSLFAARGVTGKGKVDAGKRAAAKIDDLWQEVRGREVVNQGLADTVDDAKNILTSAFLGSTAIVAATTDPVFRRQALHAWGIADRHVFGGQLTAIADTFAQLPIVRSTIAPLIDAMTGAPRKEALRSGLAMADALHSLGEQARYAMTLNGRVWSRWVADRTMQLSMLSPITETGKAVFQKEVMGWLADQSKLPFAKLPERVQDKLAGYGFDAAAWDKMREVPHYTPNQGAAGWLRPIDVAAADLEIGQRYAGMLMQETELAVPSGTHRSKAYIVGGGARGTPIMELAQSGLQFRSFGLSVATNHFQAIMHEVAKFGAVSGATSAGVLLGFATLGAAVGIQLRQLAMGLDPQNMKDPKFWMAALATGGGMGIYGDFLFADWSRYGRSLAETTAGPLVGVTNDIVRLTLGNMSKLFQGKETHAGREVANFLSRNVPIVSSLWYTRLAYQRELTDQLHYMLDPQAHKTWREQANRIRKEKGQGYWWPPGETAPSRAPDLATAVGR